MKLRELVNKLPVVTEVESGFQFNENYDVIVCGGGTAGAIAAIAAAEEGAAALCIERETFFGGMGTGIVMGYYYGEGLEGMCSRLDDEIKKESLTVYSRIKAWCEGIHCEAKKYVYEKEYKKNGGKVYYNSMAIGVFVDDNNKICGLKVLKDGVVTDISCTVVIDATSEANICRIAHLPTMSGRESDGQCQAYSLVSFAINSEKELEHIYRDNGFVDTGNMWAVSKAVTEAYASSDSTGQYSNASSKLIACGAVFGKREGLHSIGTDSMTGENLLAFKAVNRPLFKVSGPYDSHLYDVAMESDIVNEFYARGFKDTVLTMSVPYGAMVPSGIEGLLTAGLSMDIDHDALAPVRLKMNLMRSGEAAGVAALISCKTGKGLIDCYDELKERLKEREIFYDKVTVLSWLEKNIVVGDNVDIDIYLKGKKNKGEYTRELCEYLKEQDYRIFSYAFSALVKNAVNGDELALSEIRALLENDKFSHKLELNGKGKRTIVERNLSLRRYAAKKFDENGIPHNIHHYMEENG